MHVKNKFKVLKFRNYHTNFLSNFLMKTEVFSTRIFNKIVLKSSLDDVFTKTTNEIDSRRAARQKPPIHAKWFHFPIRFCHWHVLWTQLYRAGSAWSKRQKGRVRSLDVHSARKKVSNRLFWISFKQKLNCLIEEITTSLLFILQWNIHFSQKNNICRWALICPIFQSSLLVSCVFCL